MSDKLKDHRDFLAKVKKTYPNKWVEPPAFWSNKVNGVVMPTEQFCVTVRYNGVTGVTATQVITNNTTGAIGSNYSPLVFDPEKPSRFYYPVIPSRCHPFYTEGEVCLPYFPFSAVEGEALPLPLQC